MIASRVEAYPLIAQAWADWELAKAESEAKFLSRKKHPALKATELVKEKGREMAELRRRMKLAEYIATLYEFHFPWLIDFRDLDAELDYTKVDGEPDREDPVSKFLSKEEWSQFSECERNQRALERYLKGKLTPWQLGRDLREIRGLPP